MELENVKVGLRVEVKSLHSDTKGMFIGQLHLDVRAVGIKGTIVDYVSGHGGDVWWVKHDDGNVGAYVFDELEMI